MKLLSFFLLAFLALPLIALAQPAALTRDGAGWVETVSGFLAAPAAAELRIATRGSVTVEGGGGNQLSYSLRKRVQASSEAEARRLLAQAPLSTRALGNTLYLEFQPPDHRVSATLDVRAPTALRRASVHTAAGDIILRHLPAEIDAATAAGAVSAGSIGGSLSVKTGGGAVDIGAVGGNLRVNTAGGTIRVARVGGESWLDTAGGEITVHAASGVVHASSAGGSIEILRAESDVIASTGGGAITVHEAAGEVRAQTAAGGIRINSARGVRCEAAAGGIRLRNVSGALKAVTAAGSIAVELAPAPLAESVLSATAGDITVWIPSNLAVTVHALSDAAQRGQPIVSEFPEIDVRRQPGAAGNRFVASGVLNGGGPTLRLTASQGTIYLRRRSD
jgi:hypothetical protein